MGIGRYRPSKTRKTTKPDVQDLLADPMTRLIMKRDGVRRETLAKVLGVARRHLTRAASNQTSA